jgi:hypothetical protein
VRRTLPISSTTRQQRFLPYRFAEHGISVQVSRCWFESGRATGVSADVERHLLDLSNQRFEQVTLELAATLTPQVLQSVFPPPEREQPPARLLALVHCDDTRLRTAVLLSTPPTQAATYRGEVTLRRCDLAGTVSVTVVLVRSAATTSASGEWATEDGMRLASSRGWEIRVDAEPSPNGAYLDTRQEDFRAAGIARFPAPEAIYQLDFDSQAPILWINSGHRRVASMLHSSANTGRAARIRDAIFDRIEAAVWLRLLLRAVHDTIRLEEPGFSWQTAVLRRWLPRLYPDAVDHESRIDMMRQEIKQDGEDQMLDRLDLIVQTEMDAGRRFETLIEELEL